MHVDNEERQFLRSCISARTGKVCMEHPSDIKRQLNKPTIRAILTAKQSKPSDYKMNIHKIFPQQLRQYYQMPDPNGIHTVLLFHLANEQYLDFILICFMSLKTFTSRRYFQVATAENTYVRHMQNEAFNIVPTETNPDSLNS